MPKPLTCPDPDALQRFARGEPSEAEADALAQHILNCAACAKALDGLQAADPLLGCLARGPGPYLPAHPAVDALVQRLLDMPPDPSLATAPSASRTDSPGMAASSAPMPAYVGRYQIVARLGAGGMGVEVHKGVRFAL